MRIETKIWKILISSLIGGLYAVILYMNVLPIYSNIITKIILSIVWSYKIENEINYDEDEYNDIDENDFDINDSISIEEILTCTYEEDLEEIEDNIREHVIFDELKFTEPKIKENMISFKITL
jgi:hypothetical protein